MGSILVVCLAGAPESVAAEADAGATVFVTEPASVFCLWSVEAVALFTADTTCVSTPHLERTLQLRLWRRHNTGNDSYRL